ncbi:hypothetical protein II941_02990 [bacterium]|nr:hypothetical protein [bacterium]
MANCTSEKDTLLNQIASLEAKVTKLEQENKEQKTYIKFLQNKLRSLSSSLHETNQEMDVEDEDDILNDEDNQDATDEYKDFD